MDALHIMGFGGGFIGGIVGAMTALFIVLRMNEKVRSFPCPRCNASLLNKKPGKRTWTQVLWGGWTCPDCNCDVDRHGKERLS